jgi:hypothetical protein
VFAVTSPSALVLHNEFIPAAEQGTCSGAWIGSAEGSSVDMSAKTIHIPSRQMAIGWILE